MTDNQALLDPISVPFWEAATRHQLLIQRCRDCGSHQFYPRLFCLACLGENVEWVPASGTGTIYALTTVRIKVASDLIPPYEVALVTLDEGPRFLARLEGMQHRIGDRVHVVWQDRLDAPPLPLLARVPGDTEEAKDSNGIP